MATSSTPPTPAKGDPDESGQPPLESPMPRSPILDRDQPEFVDEADIPSDDENGDGPPPDDSAG